MVTVWMNGWTKSELIDDGSLDGRCRGGWTVDRWIGREWMHRHETQRRELSPFCCFFSLFILLFWEADLLGFPLVTLCLIPPSAPCHLGSAHVLFCVELVWGHKSKEATQAVIYLGMIFEPMKCQSSSQEVVVILWTAC
jgi:hypothetical protein